MPIRNVHRRSETPRSLLGLSSLVLALLIAACAHLVLEPSGRAVGGRAYALDGDTIRIGESRIRLKGIDAPELDQSCMRGETPVLCGEKARDTLLGLILNQHVECRIAGHDRYQRQLARCYVKGEDIGARMVAEGCAVSYGDYRLLEAKARLQSRGIWATTFERPQEWRRRHLY
ncbi:thermonuclease family protein [Microvirga thermotolerans]|uniref:Thermonuclease family protein n=1 Tax=Microvirga thermotolerans TaxID=2651334 RepID=A0A5P9K0I2_9HYPH|nr:thermonuclease family protein [Microvirga thermotolerans]QFU17045.1 thermonuclease family protein [Microvirga thermotolerans]